MERRQNSIKYRMLVCLVAAVLAIGLTAMPALAEPSAEASGSISIVSVDTSSGEKAEKAEAAKGDSSAAAKPSTNDSASKSESTTSTKSPASSDVLNPAEKLGAVLEGEGEVAVSNATGISTASTEEATEELDEKEQAKQDIKAAVAAGSRTVTTYYGDLSINKKFISGPLYTVLDKDGNAVAAQYTVMFKVVGYSLTSDEVIYPERTIGIKVDVGGGTGENSTQLEGLPEGRYVVTEIMYPGCGYECVSANGTSGSSSATQVIEWVKGADVNPNDSTQLATPIEFKFENKGTGTNYPNQGFVNHYRDHDEGFGWTVADRD